MTAAPKLWSPRRARWLLNLYPPFLFSRIVVRRISPDFRELDMTIAKSLLTRNLQGTTFGGSIYSAADPIYAVLLWQVAAQRGIATHAWTKSASVRFFKPAASRLTLTFRLGKDDVAEALADLEASGRHERSFAIEARDAAGQLCARVETLAHLRRQGETDRERNR